MTTESEVVDYEGQPSDINAAFSENQISLDHALVQSDHVGKIEIITEKKYSQPKPIEEYFNPNQSYFVKYDCTNMGEKLLALSRESSNQDDLLTSEVNTLGASLIPFLREQSIPSLESEEGRRCLKRSILKFKFNGKTHDPYQYIPMALCIEKYYQEVSDTTLDKHKLGLLKTFDNDGNSQEDEYCGCNITKKKCPEYPPAFQKPVFNPCEYPHVLKLYSHFYEHCYDNRNLHAQAGAYYNQMNKHFVAPTLIISALSSIASFIASSDIVSSFGKTILSLSVGVMTSLNALVQSFSSAYQFDAKANSHFNAADKYDQLITEIDFEKSYPSDTDFFPQLEKKILDVKSSCQFLVPNYIKADYYKRRERANERNFIHNKIIVPMKRELREAVVSGNIADYKFANQSEGIQREVQRIRELEKNLEDSQKKENSQCCNKTTIGSKCGCSECCIKSNMNCCFPSCSNTDDSLYEQNTFPSLN